ncbi:MAG: hypothetical protein AB7S81_09090 [Bdellovibrionales bacterium]
MTKKERATLAKQNHLRKLLQDWTVTSAKKDALHVQAAEKGAPEALKPSLLAKVTRWMEQISHLERKEQDIISEIVAVEKKHKEFRKKKKLRHFVPHQTTLDFEDEKKQRNRFWFWFFIFIMMMRRGNKSSAPQNG